MKYALVVLAAATGLATLAHAADPMPAGLLACEQIQDSAKRVHCYDNQMKAFKKAAAKAPAATISAPPAASVETASPARATTHASGIPAAAVSTQSPEVRFGQEDLSAARQTEAPKKDRYLFATLSSVRVTGPSIYLFTLSNGQVWQQDISTGNETARFFRKGDSVRIEKTKLGAYEFAVPRLGTKNWVLATRVR